MKNAKETIEAICKIANTVDENAKTAREANLPQVLEKLEKASRHLDSATKALGALVPPESEESDSEPSENQD